MDKQNPIHILLLLLVTLASYVSAEHFYIVPNDSTSQCQRYSAGTCFTLAEFASNSSYLDQDNLTLSFLPGQHLLTRRLTITGPKNIALTGGNSSNSLSTIKCQGTSGFEFRDIQSLNIAYLKFTGCGNVERGGAIYINRADNILIRGCHFTDNHVLGNSSSGGVIYAVNTVAMNIEGSIFDNNYADAAIHVRLVVPLSISDLNKAAIGGAIFVNSGNIYSTSNQCINNSAGNGGGAIGVIYGNINSINDSYINNSADLGGAIGVYSGNITSTNDQYTNNSAGNGGAIFVSSDDITSTNDQYINNSADNDGGAIYVYSGDITSTNDHYINNSADYYGGGAIYVNSGDITSTNDQYINNSADQGGAIGVLSGNITSTNDQYTNNSAGNGGAIFVSSDDITSTNDQYINNSADNDGGAIYVYSGDITSTNDHYINNSADYYGGAIYVFSGNITSTNDQYTNNSADRGGAIYDSSGDDTKLSGANFEHNSAGEGAVIYKTGGTLVIGQSNITDNFASIKGTVYMNSGTLSLSERVNFMNNQGSLYVFNTQVEFKGTVIFMNNYGDYGGAITAFLSEISFNATSTVTIFNNTATNGGGMSLTQSNLHVYHSIELTDNHATDFGGGIYAYQSDIEFNPEQTQRSEITKNTAFNGGAICAIASNIVISNTYMDVNLNIAKVNGGAIYLEQNSKIYVQKHEREFRIDGPKVRLNFTSNSAEKGGAIFVADNTNDGVICQGANTKIYQAECFLQTLGLYQTVVRSFILNLINIFFSNNTAHQSGSDIYGGLLDRCTINQIAELTQYCPKLKNFSGFDYVKATTQLEQITDYSPPFYYYGYRRNCSRISDYFMDCISRSDVKTLISSDAVRVEFCLDNVISPNYSHPNVSIKKGELFTVSLVAVDQVGNPLNATIISSFQSKSGNGRLKAGQVEQQVGDQCTELEYNVYSQDNSAQIHIHADGPCGDKGVSRKTLTVKFLPCICPIGFHPSQSENDCICECDQNSLVFCSDNVLSPNYSYTNVLKKKGEMFTISVVAVDQTGNPVNATIISSFSSESGKGHLKDSQVVQQVGNQCTELEYNVYSLDNSAQIHINWYTDTPCGNSVATRNLTVIFLPCTCPAGLHPSPSENDCICECDQSSLVFCSDNFISPNYSYHNNISIKKGEVFTVSIAAVDHGGYAVNATIISSFSSESGKGHLKDSQVVQQVGKQCTELEYNVYSLDNSAQIHINLYTDTPCGNRISTKTLNLNFLPCICPVGFQVSQSENDCICECDQRLKQHQITTCSAENETILVENNIWIGFGDYTNETELIIHDCPFDYCVQEPVHVNLSSADEQCAYNRTGILCGRCQEDLSLVFGSSRCQECSDNYISLLIPFALAGIALVAFILLFNLTVATGTIHGLIFYANILAANHSLFLPPSTSNFLTVFISWLNLYLGIETCFYDGMDSYGKFLLQLAFPTYVFVLIGTIIALCEVSKKFATLLSNRNPVAALCTLILLSYSKLIRTIITALQFTHLDYPDGPREIVWQYDANVPYFTVSHIPRFIAAFIIIILGAIYTILLLFGQWFSRCSNRKIMKWTKNTKYDAFIDAYHAPFTPKHRYWVGLLLFAQITHNLVAAMATSPVPILSAGCVALGLIMLKLLNTRIYKNRLQDSLETLFLTNIVVLAIATYHIRETNEGQLALANTSMAISFILFLIILGYHFYKYILKGTRVWARVTQCCQRKEHAPNRRQMYQLAPLEDEEPIFDQGTFDSNNQLREPALDILDPVYTEDYRVTPPPPVIHKPPKVTYTVIDAIPKREGEVPVPRGPAGQNV